MLEPKDLQNGQEQFEEYKNDQERGFQYIYRSDDGALFSTSQETLRQCRFYRDAWLLSSEKFKEIISLCGKYQDDDSFVYSYCFRCGKWKMKAEKIDNSLSRYAKIYICNGCGNSEAFSEFVPFKEWHFIQKLYHDVWAEEVLNEMINEYKRIKTEMLKLLPEEIYDLSGQICFMENLLCCMLDNWSWPMDEKGNLDVVHELCKSKTFFNDFKLWIGDCPINEAFDSENLHDRFQEFCDKKKKGEQQ